LHQMVAREKQLLLLEQVAQVIRRMARRVDHAQRAVAAEHDTVAVRERGVGSKRSILPLGMVGHAAEQRRAGGQRELGGATLGDAGRSFRTVRDQRDVEATRPAAS